MLTQFNRPVTCAFAEVSVDTMIGHILGSLASSQSDGWGGGGMAPMAPPVPTPMLINQKHSQSRQTDFWKIVHNITKSASKGTYSSASIIDKLSSDVDNANAFNRKLQGLLNSDDNAASLPKKLSLSNFISHLIQYLLLPTLPFWVKS